MTFAQRSVAGEDHTRPQIQSQDLSDTLIPPAPKRLKRKTIEAVERATRIGGLGRSARAALCALARTANNDDPNGRIFKHRETLCTETGMSSATWYRAQKELLALGLITVDVQVRKRFGRFAGAYIYLTEKATLLLGLSCAAQVSEIEDDINRLESTVEQQPPAPETLDQPSLKSRVLFTEDRYPYAFQKRQQDRLPEDLRRLRTLGLDENLIFWLMRKAKLQGHFLSHVVEATWANLIKAGSPKAYLLGLLNARTDFTAICKAIAATDSARIAQDRQRHFVDQVLRASARKRFVDGSSTEFEVESDGKSVLVRQHGSLVVSRLVGASLAEFAVRLDRGEFKLVNEASSPERDNCDDRHRLSKTGAAGLANLRALLGLATRGTEKAVEKSAIVPA